MHLQPSPQEAASELLWRRKARASLIDFTRYTKPDYEAAWAHERIAKALEAVERGDCRRLIIEAPPQHGKSELVSRRFPAWLLGRRPGVKFMGASYNQDLASDFGRDVRNLIADPEYRNIFPNVALRPDSTAANRWHTSQGGIYYAVGVKGPATGRGLDVGSIDDPFKDRADADSQANRDTVWKWYTNVFLTRQSKHAAIILTNTRWHEDDLTGRILDAAKRTGEGWEVIKLKAINEYGQALWPEQKPIDFLELIRGTMPARDWLSLYQQSPTAEEGTYFKREWMRRYSALPDSLNVYMSADFAVTEGDGDFTEIAVWGVDTKDNIYVLDWWHGQTSSDVWVSELISRFRRWEPLRMGSEGGVIRRAVEPWLDRQMRDTRTYCAIEWLPTTGDKPSMARSFQAMCAVGRVFWPETDWAERAIDQLLRFPAGKNDDVVDACGVFGRLIDGIWAATPRQKDKPTLADAWNAPVTMAEMIKPTKGPDW